MWKLAKKNWKTVAVIAAAPGGLVLLSAVAIAGGCVAVPIWAVRRYMERNRVTVINPPVVPVLRVMNGGKS